MKGILSGLKSHVGLFHLGISLDERSSELLCPTLFGKGGEKSINSLNLRDSKFTLKAFTALTQLLIRPRTKVEQYHLTGKSCNQYSTFIQALLSNFRDGRETSQSYTTQQEFGEA
jgi:hypothetical protein